HQWPAHSQRGGPARILCSCLPQLSNFELYQCSSETTASLVELARRLGQHDRNAIANRIGQPRFAADQFASLAIIFHWPLGEGANQDLKQSGIKRWLAVRFIHRSHTSRLAMFAAPL